MRTRKAGKRGVVRKTISGLLGRGLNQAEIARELDLTPATVNYHVRLLGYPAIPFRRVAPVEDGRRACFVCHAKKELAAFKNDRASTCTACIRARTKQKITVYV